jgi:hypothetical protein
LDGQGIAMDCADLTAALAFQDDEVDLVAKFLVKQRMR